MGEMRYQQGLFMLQHGKLREAINAFGKASFFMPQRPQPFIAAAECFISLCDFKGAVKQYRRALWLLRSREETDSGTVSLLSALPLDKPFEPLDFNMATIGFACFDRGDERSKDETEEFLSLTTNLATLPPSLACSVPSSAAIQVHSAVVAGDDCVLIAAVQTRLAGILDALSTVLFNVKDYVQALRFADESLQLLEHPQVMLHRCAYLIALERTDEAEKALEKHMRDCPSFSIESSSLLVHLYCQRQAFQHAKALLESILLKDRQHPQILLAQHIFDGAYSFFRQRSIDQSDVQGLTRCLAVFPEDPALYFERAKYYVSEGQDKKAVPDLFKCIKISNGSHKDAVGLMTQTLFRLGAGHDGEDNMKNAIDYYSTSLLWHADNIPVLLARGDCYTKLGDYQNALQDFLRVERISPNHSGAKRRLAHLHDVWGAGFHAQGKLEEAEREFSRAIVACEDEPRYYYHRALCRFDMNEPSYALRDVLSCQELDSKDPVIRDFVNAHLSFLSQGSEGQSSRSVELPKVPQHVCQRAVSLYGKDAAKAAVRRYNQSQEQLQTLEREEVYKAVTQRNAEGTGGGRRLPIFGTHTFTPALGSVLTCSKAMLSLPKGRLQSPIRGSLSLGQKGKGVTYAR
ncbi:tetratricopeptide repeat protein 16 [Trypanosoma rangeli]|uniref:Tetratricopeptide repeat protein 16 n=1 Tax=Trypanosoma rangeli TaxID=5698 RepID=A0A3R7KED7_TRYRA|nr:tetratricopeptide repeat protein 16 [Trypanosoma rangeli]RNF06300.1 tetratricopeptide repeat protein 16 [Trypanosoma rangeli]|eukprot:RNF06300.1 tetratricopeptide repeat protein 16 [Trypanosoma rangeli]